MTQYFGVDISEYQGDVDWKKVKAAGISFAFIRVGYRGPGEGTLEADKTAAANLKGAIENGLDVGVYFCTQAITEAEGIAEAEFVLAEGDEAQAVYEYCNLHGLWKTEL